MTTPMKTVRKEQVAPGTLTQLVERRLRWVPMLQAAIANDASFELRVCAPRPHTADSHGRTWNIDAFRTGFAHWPQCEREFRHIVDRLRDEYELQP